MSSTLQISEMNYESSMMPLMRYRRNNRTPSTTSSTNNEINLSSTPRINPFITGEWDELINFSRTNYDPLTTRQGRYESPLYTLTLDDTDSQDTNTVEERGRRRSRLRRIFSCLLPQKMRRSTGDIQYNPEVFSLSIPVLPRPTTSPPLRHFPDFHPAPASILICRRVNRRPDIMRHIAISGSSSSGKPSAGGADIGKINSLPYFNVTDVERQLPPDHRNCTICLQDFCAGETRMTLPCVHGFHKECAEKWLALCGRCPLCQHQV